MTCGDAIALLEAAYQGIDAIVQVHQVEAGAVHGTQER